MNVSPDDAARFDRIRGALAAPLRVRKKPIEVEAMHFDGTEPSADAIIGWAGAEPVSNVTTTPTFNAVAHVLTVPTLEGPMAAKPGWWIIRGVKGEFYPCDPEVFEATYEPA